MTNVGMTTTTLEVEHSVQITHEDIWTLFRRLVRQEAASGNWHGGMCSRISRITDVTPSRPRDTFTLTLEHDGSLSQDDVARLVRDGVNSIDVSCVVCEPVVAAGRIGSAV